MEKVLVTRPMLGILYCQVCVENGTSDDEILKQVNLKNPCGTNKGWVTVHKTADEISGDKILPVPCEDYSNRTHFIVSC